MPSHEATKIANGHAWNKHRREFPEFSTALEFAQHIDRIMSAPSDSKPLQGGRQAFWHAPSRTIVIRNPRDPDGGTAFRPIGGRAYYHNLK